jgi:hypothetical protein
MNIRVRSSGSRPISHAFRIPAASTGYFHRKASSHHQFHQELDGQLLDIAVHDFTDRGLRHLEHARRFRLAPLVSLDVLFKRGSKLTANVKCCGLLLGKTGSRNGLRLIALASL